MKILGVEYVHVDQVFSLMCLHQVSKQRHYWFGYDPDDSMILVRVPEDYDVVDINAYYTMASRYLQRALGQVTPGRADIYDAMLWPRVRYIAPSGLLSGQSKATKKFWSDLWDTYNDPDDDTKHTYFRALYDLSKVLDHEAHHSEFDYNLRLVRWSGND